MGVRSRTLVRRVGRRAILSLSECLLNASALSAGANWPEPQWIDTCGARDMAKFDVVGVHCHYRDVPPPVLAEAAAAALLAVAALPPVLADADAAALLAPAALPTVVKEAGEVLSRRAVLVSLRLRPMPPKRPATQDAERLQS